LQDVNTDLQITSPQIVVDIDRDKASTLGISADQIQTALGRAYGAQQISTIYTPSNQYWVILEVDPESSRIPPRWPLLSCARPTGAGAARPIATLTPGWARSVTTWASCPAVTISFNTKPGVSLSEAVAQVEAVQRELRIPATLSATFQGTAQAFQDSLKGRAAPAHHVLVIYLVLGVLYESFIHPLTILSGCRRPGGRAATLMLFGWS
jgi:HAE1 family hydrophobic/amphiphilic exporter-1